jgi:uncharacterized FlgJ-related protein
MFLKFDKNQLAYVKDKKGFKICLGVLVGITLISFFIGRFAQFKALDKYEKELVILNLEKERNKFTEEKFVELIKDLNMKFPHIVYAQAKIESGNFKSAVFKQNNNLFGMKEAKTRATLSQGTHRGHAYYDTWQESLYDYAMYYNTYLRKIKTEDEYFEYLRQNYAEDKSYVTRLKALIKKNNLKSKFN